MQQGKVLARGLNPNCVKHTSHTPTDCMCDSPACTNTHTHAHASQLMSLPGSGHAHTGFGVALRSHTVS